MNKHIYLFMKSHNDGKHDLLYNYLRELQGFPPLRKKKAKIQQKPIVLEEKKPFRMPIVAKPTWIRKRNMTYLDERRKY